MIAPLVIVDDLEGQPGGPFTEAQVRSAAAIVRRQAGWHIAPEVAETLVLDSHGGDHLWLPTRYVTDVLAVRDVSGGTPADLTGWRWSQDGMLSIPGRFPAGFRVVEVDLTHGYPACPDDLLPVVADRTSRSVAQESLGSRSVTYGVDGGRDLNRALGLYSIGPRP